MARGFTKTSTGFRAWVRVSSKAADFDELRTKRFDRSATVAEIQAWRAQTKLELEALRAARRQQHAERAGLPHTFRADATAYLKAVRAMPSYADRARQIAVWVEVFGDRRRNTIQPHEIRAMRDQWLTIGPRRVWKNVNGVGQWVSVAEPLAASTVNGRLRALSNLWTVLDGRRATNPVRDEVPEADEPHAIPRAIDYDVIRKILDAMADVGYQPEKGKDRPLESRAKVRARVMAWTGTEPTELGRIPEQAIREAIATTVLVVPGRQKGSGAPGRLIPLNEDALAALEDLVRLQAWGPFDRRAVLRAWKIACRKVVGRTLRIKDLRHSFVTGIVRATNNLATAQLLAGHADARTTRRYALAAVLPMLRAGMDAFTTDTADKEKP